MRLCACDNRAQNCERGEQKQMITYEWTFVAFTKILQLIKKSGHALVVDCKEATLRPLFTLKLTLLKTRHTRTHIHKRTQTKTQTQTR